MPVKAEYFLQTGEQEAHTAKRLIDGGYYTTEPNDRQKAGYVTGAAVKQNNQKEEERLNHSLTN